MSAEEKNPDLCSEEEKERRYYERETWKLQEFVKLVYETRSKEPTFPESENPIDDFLVRNSDYIRNI